jgi:hypothetical protein
VRRATNALLAGALLAAGLALGWALFAPPPSNGLADATRALGAEGVDVGFTVDEPTRIGFEVRLPAGLRPEAKVLRLRPALRPELLYVVEPVASMASQEGGILRGHADLAHAGAYALRIPAIPMAMGAMPPTVHVRVWSD